MTDHEVPQRSPVALFGLMICADMASRCLSPFEIYMISFLMWQSYLVVSGDIIVSPRDTETSIGETTELYCKSTVGAIEWHHLRPDTDIPEIVYKNGYIFNGYKERFDARNCNDAAGECNLVIHNVSLEDSGTYTCMEKSDEAVHKAAQLIVFEQYPSTKFCITRITCSPVCDTLELSCNMKYSANMEALMEWRDSAGNLLPSAITTVNATKTSIVHLNKDLSQSPSYTCQVIYPTSSLGSRYNYTHSPQDLVASNAVQESCSQTVTALALSLAFAIVLLISVIIGFISWKLKRETERRHKARPIAGNGQNQLADDERNLIYHHTPLVNKGSIDDRCQCVQHPAKRRRTVSS